MDNMIIWIVVAVLVVVLVGVLIAMAVKNNNKKKLTEASELRREVRERESGLQQQHSVAKEQEHRARAAEEESRAKAAESERMRSEADQHRSALDEQHRDVKSMEQRAEELDPKHRADGPDTGGRGRSDRDDRGRHSGDAVRGGAAAVGGERRHDHPDAGMEREPMTRDSHDQDRTGLAGRREDVSSDPGLETGGRHSRAEGHDGPLSGDDSRRHDGPGHDGLLPDHDSRRDGGPGRDGPLSGDDSRRHDGPGHDGLLPDHDSRRDGGPVHDGPLSDRDSRRHDGPSRHDGDADRLRDEVGPEGSVRDDRGRPGETDGKPGIVDKLLGRSDRDEPRP